MQPHWLELDCHSIAYVFDKPVLHDLGKVDNDTANINILQRRNDLSDSTGVHKLVPDFSAGMRHFLSGRWSIHSRCQSLVADGRNW